MQTVGDGVSKPMLEVRASGMENPAYRVEVWRFLFGQHRIQLFAVSDDPYPIPVRELCTYDWPRMAATIVALKESPDPLAHCVALEAPWNCEAPGTGRIRLDNTRENQIGPWTTEEELGNQRRTGG